MVDIRPLLFANFLAALILVSAAFANFIPPHDSVVASDIPPVWDQPQDSPRSTSDIQEFSQKEAIAEDNPPTSEPGLNQQTNEQNKIAGQESDLDAAIFADAEQIPPAETLKAEQAQVVSEPKESVVNVISTEPPKPVTTGTLIVRSNVYDDTVLINGKPYGSSKLELELTPGSYSVEVAKAGYESWTTRVDIRRGQDQTLNARLAHYTKVNYNNGVWENDVKTGEGSFTEEGKLEYQGSFVNGKFHGNGSIRYANGMRYQGEWHEGKMKGQGTLTTTEGDTYVGEFDEGKFNGDGTLTKANGDIYTGFWIDGDLNGQGSLTTRDGMLYVGGFADNLFHGSGSLTYPDGGHYEGSFSNGLFHGKGVEVYPDGKKYVGQFIEGLYHGKGEILNPNGSKITGTFKDGEPFGKATLTTAEGEVFTARSSEPGVCYRLKSYRATECPKLEGW